MSTGIRAYEQLGYRAFGTPGKLAAALAITLQNIGGEALAGAAVCRTGEVSWLAGLAGLSNYSPVSSPAMSSYLYIIKSELPLVIQTFLNLEKPTS